jgi:hypothetical protein
MIALAGVHSSMFKLGSLTIPLLWTILEIHMSIICSCLPLVPGLLRHYRGKSELGSQAAGWPSNYHDVLSPRDSQYQPGYTPSESLELRAKSSQDFEVGLVHGPSPNVA